jgi:O-antigen ligase
MLPMLRPSGPGNSSPVDVLIGLCIVMTAVWAVRSRPRLHLPYAVPVGIMFAAGAIAGLAGPFPGLTLLTLFQDLVLLSWAAALVAVARAPGAFRLLLRAWAAGATAWAALLLITYPLGIHAVSGVNATDGPRASLLAGDPNLLATYFVVSIMVTAAAGWPARRWLRGVLIAVQVGGLVLTFSNGGMLALAVATGVALVIRGVRRMGPIPVAIPIAVAVLIAGAAIWAGLGISTVQDAARDSGRPVLENSLGRSDQSVWQRQTILQESIDLFHQRGWIGWGPEATKGELLAQQAPYANEAHDDYFAALIERGLLGAFGLLVLIAAISFRLRSLIRGRARSAFNAVMPGTASVVGAVLGMATFATNESILHLRQVWALFAIVAAWHLWAAARRIP